MCTMSVWRAGKSVYSFMRKYRNRLAESDPSVLVSLTFKGVWVVLLVKCLFLLTLERVLVFHVF